MCRKMEAQQFQDLSKQSQTLPEYTSNKWFLFVASVFSSSLVLKDQHKIATLGDAPLTHLGCKL